MSIGLTMPLARSTGTVGFLASTDTEIQATFSNLRALLLTNWGERPNHFFLGCNLGEFVFAPQSQETQELIVQRIETQVADFLPYVSLDRVDVSFNDDHRIIIKISFSLRDRINLSNTLEVVVFPS